MYKLQSFPPNPAPEGRPANEEYTWQRYDELYYTFLDIRPRIQTDQDVTFAPAKEWKDIYFFRDTDELNGWYRYERPDYDWYIQTAIEKLNKLPEAEQTTFDRNFVFGLRYAIRQKYQRGGSEAYVLPACRNSRKAVENWIRKTLDQYEDKVD